MNRRAMWTLPYAVFMICCVVLPLLLVVVYAFQDAEGHWTLQQLNKFVHQPEAFNTFIYSIEIALVTTVLCILFGYPAAYVLSRKEFSFPGMMVVLFILPMWVNVLVRTLATVALFDFLRFPLGEGALIFGMVYNFLPFMVYPIYLTLCKLDQSYVEAAQDLGATPWQVFSKVVVPLSMPGVVSGVMMVFMPTISTFAIAELLTMNKVKLFGTTIQENINSGMWNYGSALALVMLVIICLTTMLTRGKETHEYEKGGLI